MGSLTTNGADRLGARACRLTIIVALAAVPAAALYARLAWAEISSGAPQAHGVNHKAVLGLLGDEQARYSSLIDDAVPSDAEPDGEALADAGLDRPVPGIDDRTSRAALDMLSGLDADTVAAITAARGRGFRGIMAPDTLGHTRGASREIDPAEILDVEVGTRDKQWRCLAEALYFEARGEDLFGQVAVAEVVLNRVDSKVFPGTVCGVVRQGTGKRNGCQFSFYCDGKPEDIANRRTFEEVGKVAWVMLHGKPRILTGNATYYHTVAVKPRWAKRMVRTARIGAHIFYRRSLQLSER